MGEIKGESNKHALLMMNANGGPKTLCHPGEKECLCANDDEMFPNDNDCLLITMYQGPSGTPQEI